MIWYVAAHGADDVITWWRGVGRRRGNERWLYEMGRNMGMTHGLQGGSTARTIFSEKEGLSSVAWRSVCDSMWR